MVGILENKSLYGYLLLLILVLGVIFSYIFVINKEAREDICKEAEAFVKSGDNSSNYAVNSQCDKYLN